MPFWAKFHPIIVSWAARKPFCSALAKLLSHVAPSVCQLTASDDAGSRPLSNLATSSLTAWNVGCLLAPAANTFVVCEAAALTTLMWPVRFGPLRSILDYFSPSLSLCKKATSDWQVFKLDVIFVYKACTFTLYKLMLHHFKSCGNLICCSY